MFEPVAKGLAAGAEGWVDPPNPPNPVVEGVVLKEGCEGPPPNPEENDGVPPNDAGVGVEGAPNPDPKPDEGAEGCEGVDGKAGNAAVVEGVDAPPKGNPPAVELEG